jgi:hypothetical protein
VTLYCQHRVNDPEALRALPKHLGVEIDLRSWGDSLHLEHDPYVKGPDFEEWLDAYDHAFIVVNIKEEGLEDRIAERLAAHGVTEWAFLDESFPFLVRTLRQGKTNTMVRISEFEKPETALALDPRPDWIWLDSFTGSYPDPSVVTRLAEHGYRFMIVSPELQKREPEPEIPVVKQLFEAAGVELHAVCTKRPDLWG